MSIRSAAVGEYGSTATRALKSATNEHGDDEEEEDDGDGNDDVGESDDDIYSTVGAGLTNEDDDGVIRFSDEGRAVTTNR